MARKSKLKSFKICQRRIKWKLSNSNGKEFTPSVWIPKASFEFYLEEVGWVCSFRNTHWNRLLAQCYATVYKASLNYPLLDSIVSYRISDLTMGELLAAKAKIYNVKTPGSNRERFELIKWRGSKLDTYLHKFFNYCWQCAQPIPPEWVNTEVVLQ